MEGIRLVSNNNSMSCIVATLEPQYSIFSFMYNYVILLLIIFVTATEVFIPAVPYPHLIYLKLYQMSLLDLHRKEQQRFF